MGDEAKSANPVGDGEQNSDSPPVPAGSPGYSEMQTDAGPAETDLEIGDSPQEQQAASDGLESSEGHAESSYQPQDEAKSANPVGDGEQNSDSPPVPAGSPGYSEMQMDTENFGDSEHDDLETDLEQEAFYNHDSLGL